MAIVLTKKKAAPAPAKAAPVKFKKKSALAQAAEQQLVSDFAGLIDEVGELEAEAEKLQAKAKEILKAIEPLAAKRKELDEKIQEIIADPDAKGEELGTKYKVEWGKQGTKRELTDLAEVRKMLGDDLFFSLAKVNLGDVDDYLTPPQKEKVIATSRTDRKFKIVKRAA